MSLREMVKSVASAGRYGDEHLLHISSDELRDLKKTGMVTTNPETGLPEAFSFGHLLKAIIPVAAAYFGGPILGEELGSATAGSALAGAAGGALSGGGLKGAATLNGRLSPAQRKASARRAANARWSKNKT